jgi:DNA-binding CsgD family transcriptional regulator
MANFEPAESGLLPQTARKLREGSHSYRLPTDSLSPREMEVCRLLANGLQLKEVAFELDLSYHTVDIHKRNSYHKLGIHSRFEMIKHFGGEQRSGKPQGISDTEVARIHERLSRIETTLMDLIQRMPSERSLD